ncbi:MAG: beta-ketoacyl-ACP synthase II [Phycisphaerales bacterium]
MTQQRRRVVITGVGAVTNLGLDYPSTWDAMIAGRSGVSLIDDPRFEQWPAEKWDVKIAGAIRGWEPTSRLEGREVRKLDRCTQLGVAAGMEAVERSGMDFTTGDGTRRGVIIGSGIGGIQTIETGVEVLLSKGPDRINPFTVPRLMANAVAGDLSIRYGLLGHSDSHTTACASSGHSIGAAMRLIQFGEADVMLAGGSEAAISPLCMGAFMTMRALSTRNETPQTASRPFDRSRDGFVLAEGAAVLVLESEEHARARGAEILAELVAYGATSDANHITAPHAEGDGAARAMEVALRDARLNPTDIDFVNAHGTSTPLGDAAEVKAVLRVFGDHARKSAGGRLLMSSSKSMTGHCLGASGVVEMVSCLGAIRHGAVTPTINCHENDEGFDVDFVPNTARDAKVRYAMNNTFGFGGHNVTLVVAAYQG